MRQAFRPGLHQPVIDHSRSSEHSRSSDHSRSSELWRKAYPGEAWLPGASATGTLLCSSASGGLTYVEVSRPQLNIMSLCTRRPPPKIITPRPRSMEAFLEARAEREATDAVEAARARIRSHVKAPLPSRQDRLQEEREASERQRERARLDKKAAIKPPTSAGDDKESAPDKLAETASPTASTHREAPTPPTTPTRARLERSALFEAI